jgi:hypothetical protein
MLLNNSVLNLSILLLLFLVLFFLKNLMFRKSKLFTSESFFLTYIILVSFISLFFAKLITVNILTLLLICFYMIYLKQNRKNQSNFILNQYENSNFIHITLVFIFSFIYFNFFTYFLHDHFFYAKLSQSLIKTGVENINSLYQDFPIQKKIMLYHYTDLWLNGFVSHLFKINPVLSLNHIIYPFLLTIFFWIVYDFLLIHFYSTKAFFISLFIVFGSTIVCFPILTLEQGEGAFWHHSFPHITSFKSLTLYPSILLLFHNILNKRYVEGIFYALICILQSVTLFPSIFISINLLLFIHLILSKNKFAFIKYLVFFNLIILCLFGFVFFVNMNSSSVNNSTIEHYIPSVSYLTTNYESYFQKFIDFLLYPFYLFPLAVIGILFLYRKAYSILFLFLVIFSGLFFSVLFEKFHNSIQSYSIILPIVMIYFLIELFLLNNKIISRSFFLLLFLFSFLNLKNNSYFSTGNIQLSSFDKKIFDFSKTKIRNNQWLYYSLEPYSTWMYSANICRSPLILNSDAKMGLEIQPFFSANLTDYLNKNPDYPLNNSIKRKNIFTYLKKYSVKYIFIENIDSVDFHLSKYLKPELVENKRGIWKIIN